MLRLIVTLFAIAPLLGCSNGPANNPVDKVQIVNEEEVPTESFQFEEIFESYSRMGRLKVKNFTDSPCILKHSDFSIIGEQRFSFSILPFEDLEISPQTTAEVPVRFWPTNVGEYQATGLIDSTSCGASRIDLLGAGKPFVKDKNGIIRAGGAYHPVGIGNFANRLWNKLAGSNSRVITQLEPKREDQETLDRFLQYAQWFQENLEINEHDVHVWYYRFNYPSYNLRSPWVSGMAQGVGISVLAKAYLLSGDPSFLSTAQLALRAFERETSEGGVVQYDGLGYPHYAEYPSNPKSFVLNGFIIGSLGVYDLWRVSQDEKAKEIFDRAVTTVRVRLPDYDLGINTNYQLIMPIQTFTLVNRTLPVGSNVKVASFSFDAENRLEKAFRFDVGFEASQGKEWWQAKLWQNRNHKNWSEAHEDEGNRTYRFFEIPTETAQVKVNLRPPENINSPGSYGLTVEYFDDFSGAIDVLVYDGKDYPVIGTIEGGQTNRWTSKRIEFTQGIRGGGTNKGYAQLHVDLLDTLYTLTEEEIFKKYSAKFAGYIPLLPK
jgi:hypothetical protein